MKSFLGNFYRHLAIFSGHTDDILDFKERQFGNELEKKRERLKTRHILDFKERLFGELLLPSWESGSLHQTRNYLPRGDTTLPYNFSIQQKARLFCKTHFIPKMTKFLNTPFT